MTVATQECCQGPAGVAHPSTNTAACSIVCCALDETSAISLLPLETSTPQTQACVNAQGFVSCYSWLQPNNTRKQVCESFLLNAGYGPKESGLLHVIQGEGISLTPSKQGIAESLDSMFICDKQRSVSYAIHTCQRQAVQRSADLQFRDIRALALHSRPATHSFLPKHTTARCCGAHLCTCTDHTCISQCSH